MNIRVDWSPGWGPEKLSHYDAPDPARGVLVTPTKVWGFKSSSRNIGSHRLRDSHLNGRWVSRRKTLSSYSQGGPVTRYAYVTTTEPSPCSAMAVHLAVLPNFSLGSPWYTDEWVYIGVMTAWGIHSSPNVTDYATRGTVPVKQTYKYYGKSYRIVARVECPLREPIHEHALDDFIRTVSR